MNAKKKRLKDRTEEKRTRCINQRKKGKTNDMTNNRQPRDKANTSLHRDRPTWEEVADEWKTRERQMEISLD